jgi:hypothetical protein
VLGIASVDDPNLEAPLLENFVNRDPVDPGRFHHDRLDPALCEPISKPVQIASERSERADRFGIARGADGRHVNCRADIDRCRIWMYRQHAPLFTAPFCFHHDNVPPSLEQKGGAGPRRISIS